jgi:probable phosphoglycerate mutase
VSGLLRVPFWFLRHGETDWNKLNRTQGRTDVPLNENGIAQAHAAAERLRGRGIRAVACSPLQRARRTADIVAGILGAEVEVHQDLQEANFGAHEGEVMGAWFASWVAGEAVPERGESFAELEVRALAAVNHVLNGPGPALIVAHGGFFRAVRAAMGFSAAVRTPNGVPLYCAPVEGGAWEMVEG